jgi:hypothetical protein
MAQGTHLCSEWFPRNIFTYDRKGSQRTLSPAFQTVLENSVHKCSKWFPRKVFTGVNESQGTCSSVFQMVPREHIHQCSNLFSRNVFRVSKVSHSTVPHSPQLYSAKIVYTVKMSCVLLETLSVVYSTVRKKSITSHSLLY